MLGREQVGRPAAEYGSARHLATVGKHIRVVSEICASEGGGACRRQELSG